MARAFSEMVKQCSRMARGSISPTFIFSGTRSPSRRIPSEHPVYLGMAVRLQLPQRLPLLHPIADVSSSLKFAVRGSPQNPLPSISADLPRNPRIRFGLSFLDHLSQAMAAIGLDDEMHILSGPEPGSKADNQRSIDDPRGRISFGQNGIHENIRFQDLSHGTFRIDDYRNLAFFPGTEYFFGFLTRWPTGLPPSAVP